MASGYTAAELRMWELGREFERARQADAFAQAWCAAMDTVDGALALALERDGHGFELDELQRAHARDLYRRYMGLALGLSGGGDR